MESQISRQTVTDLGPSNRKVLRPKSYIQYISHAMFPLDCAETQFKPNQTATLVTTQKPNNSY